MSARGWVPGDVALVRPMYCDHPDVVAVRTGVPTNMGWAYSMEAKSGSTQTWSSDPDGLWVVRPLVVIDPDDREQVAQVLRAYGDQFTSWTPDLDGTNVDRLQRALRSLTEPPKPPEPLGLGAVVIDGRGDIWVRNDLDDDCKWRSSDGTWAEWSEINAVRELSPGLEVRDV